MHNHVKREFSYDPERNLLTRTHVYLQRPRGSEVKGMVTIEGRRLSPRQLIYFLINGSHYSDDRKHPITQEIAHRFFNILHGELHWKPYLQKKTYCADVVKLGCKFRSESAIIYFMRHGTWLVDDLKAPLTQTLLKRFATYDPFTGVFTRRVEHGRLGVGDALEVLLPTGYYRIRFGNTFIRAHRAAFLYMTGHIPKEVDHKNRIRTDNRWDNLRDGSNGVNDANRSVYKNSTLGYAGIEKEASTGKYRVRISSGGKRKAVGTFKTLEEAISARRVAEVDRLDKALSNR